MDNNKPVASVCHGQQILAAIPGVLAGKKATAYPTCKFCVEANYLRPVPTSRIVEFSTSLRGPVGFETGSRNCVVV